MWKEVKVMTIFVPQPRFDQCEHKQQQSMKHPKIINLANIELTDTQKTVLDKGLKFAPTPKDTLLN